MRSNIASAINAAHASVEAAKREGGRCAVECGRLLAQAKETVPHGGWDAWLRLNTAVSPRTAQLYMRIARHVEADPAKAQRVAGLSLREAAAEVAGPTRATAGRKPLPPEGEAWLAEFRGLWAQARLNPHWREEFARYLHNRGEVSREERDRIIRGAWFGSGLTAEEREEAARRQATPEYLPGLADLPAGEARALLPVLRHFAGTDMAIAVRDQLARRGDA